MSSLLKTAKSHFSEELIQAMEATGWKFDEYSIELVHKDIPIVIEFCIGDFCTYPCSKRGHWLLETKYRAVSLMDAFQHVAELQAKIDRGEHWVGEED